MRITNNIIQRDSLASIQRNLRQMGLVQQRVSSGLRLLHASDDPNAASTSMRTRSELRALDQYRRGIQIATSRATSEETALDQLGNTLIRARELAIAYGSDTADASARQVGKAEIDQLLHLAVSLGNTRHDDGYLFGGAKATERPYSVVDNAGVLDFTTTSPTGELLIEVSPSMRVASSRGGAEVFEDTGALAALRDLGIALGNNDAEGIRAAGEKLDQAFRGVQNLIGDVGARTNLLEVTAANLDALEINLQTLKSETEEVDIERAITELMSRQTTFQAAMLATSRVMGLTLADYLR